MPVQFSPEAQKIIEELPGVQAEFNATTEALRTTERELGGLARRHSDIVTTHETAVADLTGAHSQAVFNTYDRRIQRAMTAIATDAENPLAIPAPEVCEQVAQLDELIQAAAGQPVIVTKPGENWFDVIVLPTPERHDMPDAVGLQMAYGREADKRAVELPSVTRIPLAVDSTTAEEPTGLESKHGDLRRRAFIRHDSGDYIRPAIDPLNTRVVASDIIPMATGNAALSDMPITEVMAAVGYSEEAESEQETTFILVGYSALQQVFNTILGFTYDDSLETYRQFRRAQEVQQRFEAVNINFDADSIDGVLSYRIAAREDTAQQTAEGFYERTLLQALKTKRAQLIESGLISV
jgi:antitoxin (DNA-binding transcriptional repressor) of toxin-antitoxin stability system